MAHCEGAARSLYPESTVHVAADMSDPFSARVTLPELPFICGSVHNVYGQNFQVQPSGRRSQVGNLKIPPLLSADGLILLASSNRYLQPARSSSAPLRPRAWFPGEKAGLLPVSKKSLPQAQQPERLSVLFTSDRRMER